MIERLMARALRSRPTAPGAISAALDRQELEGLARPARTRWLPLVGLALLLGASGCLVPQDIEAVENTTPTNAPPRIVARSPAATELWVPIGCSSLALRLFGLEDGDRGDELEVRWFVNHGLDPAPVIPAERIPAPLDGASLIRPGSELHLALEHWSHAPQPLIVEAVVSDGFDPDSGKDPRFRAVLDGRDVAEAVWLVWITQGAECVVDS